MKSFKSLTAVFLLATAALTGCVGQSSTPEAEKAPPPPATTVDLNQIGQQQMVGFARAVFDANQVAFDANTYTGQCFAITSFNGLINTLTMSTVPCTQEVLDRVPAGKRQVFNEAGWAAAASPAKVAVQAPVSVPTP